MFGKRATRFGKAFLLTLLVVAMLGVLSVVSAQDDAPIVVTWWSEPSNLDIHSFGTDGDSDARIAAYATLIAKNQVEGPYEGTTVAVTGDYVPMLAESWEVDDDGALAFTLRSGLMFANGNPLTSSDVKFTFDRTFNSPTSYVGSLLTLAGVSSADQVEITDDTHFRIVPTNGVTPMLYELLSELNTVIVDEETIRANATEDDPWATEWLTSNTAGAGPYVLSRVEPGVEFAYAPNPNFYDAANTPENSGVVIKVIPSAADRVLLLRNGDVDVLRGVPFSEIDDLKQTEGVKVLTYPSLDGRLMGMNNNIAPFDNVKVRQAIAYAIPYEEILQSVWAGYADPLQSIIFAGMPTSDFSHWMYDTDLDKARQLLAEAGYPDGFETTLFARADNQEDQQVAVIVQDALREIGVTLNIENLLSGAYAARQFGDRDMPMFFFNWISYVNDPFYHFHFLMECGQGTNYADYCDPAADALIKEGLATTDPARIQEISEQLQQMHMEASPWIYLAQPNSVTVMRSNIQGWAEFPDGIARYWTLFRGE
jgi:peptide/nickel transport system substrate-binding protein